MSAESDQFWISKELSGFNMRLTAGGIGPTGRVGVDDLWQCLPWRGKLCLDRGNFDQRFKVLPIVPGAICRVEPVGAESDTSQLIDWKAQTPPKVLSQQFYVQPGISSASNCTTFKFSKMPFGTRWPPP